MAAKEPGDCDHRHDLATRRATSNHRQSGDRTRQTAVVAFFLQPARASNKQQAASSEHTYSDPGRDKRSPSVSPSMHNTRVYDTLICFGDSLTQQASQPHGFVAQLQNAYQRRLEIVSRGFSGYTSRQGLALCPILFDLSEPSGRGGSGSSSDSSDSDGGAAKLATVWLGTNDCIAPGFDQHVPVAEYTSNMRRIVMDYFGTVDTLLITPATVVPGRFEGHMDDASMVEYGEALRRIAAEANEARLLQAQQSTKSASPVSKVVVVDMHKLFCDAADKLGGPAPLFVEDGLHISQQGYQVVFDGVMDAIRTNYRHKAPDALPFVFPHWTDLDLAADTKGQLAQLQPRRG